MIPTLLQVALGGAIGAAMRWSVGLAVARAWAPGFPVATLSVNVLGGFAMGIVAAVIAGRDMGHMAPFLMVGVLGGFTTFSAFSLETITLIERGAVGHAVLYVGLSVFLSVGALAVGLWLGRGWVL